MTKQILVNNRISLNQAPGQTCESNMFASVPLTMLDRDIDKTWAALCRALHNGDLPSTLHTGDVVSFEEGVAIISEFTVPARSDLTLEKAMPLIEKFNHAARMKFEADNVFHFLRDEMAEGEERDKAIEAAGMASIAAKDIREELRKRLWAALAMAVQSKAPTKVKDALEKALRGSLTMDCDQTIMEVAEELAEVNDTFTLEDLGL